ncbi:MAG: hypothetical protein DHS20C01_13830 [marine bacterium B5-7]|nr:MAG: hypothetical protein DHS20C01_13830 [marine bacterium B5-7]
MRGEYWWVGLKVLFALFHFLRIRKRYALGLRGCYVAAVARAVGAKVIATMIDNNNWDRGLANATGCRVVCIGNGWRHPNHIPNKCFDCYLAFNSLPNDPLLPFSIFIRDFGAVGHLKMGLYQEQLHSKLSDSKRIQRDKYILWVSQYRLHHYNHSTDDPFILARKKAETRGVCLMSQIAGKLGYKFCVAPSSAKKGIGYSEEYDFMQEASNGRAEVLDYRSNAWGSYDAVQHASLVIGMYSTLLLEALSVGKKVLFFLPKEMDAYVNYVSQGLSIKQIAPIAISSMDYDESYTKINEALAATDSGYRSQLGEYLNVMAPFKFDRLPQTLIKDKLLSIVASGSAQAHG